MVGLNEENVRKLKKFEIPIAKIRLPVTYAGVEKRLKKLDKTEPKGAVGFCPSCKKVYVDNPNNLCPICKQPLQIRFFTHLWNLGAEHVGRKVLVKALIAGESQPKAFYPFVEARCGRCGTIAQVDLLAEGASRALVAIFSRDLTAEQIIRDSLEKDGCEEGGKHKWSIEEVGEPQDYRELFLRDIFDFEEVTEKSVTARNYRAYFLGKPPSEKKVLLDGEVVLTPKNELVLLVREATPLDDFSQRTTLTEHDLKQLQQLQGMSFEGLLNFADSYVAPRIVGREYAKLCSLLTACSPTWIKVGYSIERGCLRTLFIGDPRTGKGSIIEYYAETLKIGEHGVGEAASRAGLLYFVEPETNTLIWGLLVQADLGLIGIEGLHGLPSEQLAEFREALHNMRVEVSKKVSGSAWARVRILADANTPIPLSNEVYPALAITKVKCLQDPIDVTRWDLMVPFASTDVPPEKIAEGRELPADYEEKLLLLKKLIGWVWSRRVDQITFSAEALAKAKAAAPKLIEEYAVDEVPLIHNATLETLLRLACSFAALTFSSPDGKQLVVKEGHVEMAGRLVRELAELWDLAGLKAALGSRELSDEEYEKVEKLLKESEVARRLLNEIALRPERSNILANKLGCNASYIRDVANEFKALGLVKTTSRGYALTAKGAYVVRHLLLKPPPTPPNKTNKTNSQKGGG